MTTTSDGISSDAGVAAQASGYERLLVAIDFSDQAWQVLDQARELAAHYGASIDIVHVAETPTNCYGPIMGLPAGGDMQLQDDILATMKKHLLDETVREENLHALLGHPATAISDFAEKMQADLLVLGTHGRHGLRSLLGSTASAVIQSAPCDTLLVKIAE